MKKIGLIILTGILLGTVSCTKDEVKKDKVKKEDLIGTWTASSGKYNLSLTITASDYSFFLIEPGNGGVTDNGTYEISEEGRIMFTNKDNPLAIGTLQNEKLSITFVNSLMIAMLGTGPASNLTFTLSDEGDTGDSIGYLVIQNLSSSNDIVGISFYDGNGKFLDSDSDVLEAGYQVTYEVVPGTYSVKITDSKGKSFQSKSFKVVKDKSTVLAYKGTTFEVLATGVDKY